MTETLDPEISELSRRIYEEVKPASNEHQLDLTRYIVEERVRQTYPQEWWAYNQAQTKEKKLFQMILLELCRLVIPNRRKIHRGRPALSKADKAFCVGLYSFCGLSSRRVISDLETAQKFGWITKVPHFNTVLNYLDNKELTSHLASMIEISSLPLRAIEKTFAVDSTGFSTPRFDRWLDIRTQKHTKKRLWKKAHLMTGTDTNVITSMIITDGVDGDSPHLIPLMERTRTYFDMKEVLADKAYSSRANLQAISDNGAIPFIPFKEGTTGKARGCPIWHKMYDFFTKNRKEFDEHYHKRSNVESTNSMIKRKFGNNLRTKRHTAQTNEILVKCLCHNICVLIQESFERGIDLDLNKCAEHYFCTKKG